MSPMANKIIVMPEITVRVITGETCYAAEGGFSSISAEVAPEDANLVGQLSQAREGGDIITLRCAMLDVTGNITNCISESGKKVFVLVIDDLIYRRPGG